MCVYIYALSILILYVPSTQAFIYKVSAYAVINEMSRHAISI